MVVPRLQVSIQTLPTYGSLACDLKQVVSIVQRDRYASFLRIQICLLGPEHPSTTVSRLLVLYVATVYSVSRSKLFQR